MKISREILKSFLEEEFGEVKERGDEFLINSPFTNDSKFHMYINPDKGVYNDFKTSNSGLIVNFISEYLSLNRADTIKYLISKYYSVSGAKELEEVIEEEEAILEMPKNIYFFSNSKQGLLYNKAYNYLLNRNIPKENINKLGFIYDGSSDYHNTIFIPFYENKEIVYFITRDFSGYSGIRYKNPEKLNSKNFVFNVDKIKDEVFIFEGVLDVLTLKDQVGTATLSADMSAEQVRKIKRKKPKRIIMVPDHDDTGKSTLIKNIDLIKQYISCDIFIYDVKNGKDFNSSGENYINISECRPYNKIQEAVRRLM